MGEKPKARGSKAKTSDRSAEEKQKAQSERFIEAARAIGVDETGKEFDLALAKIMPSKRRRKTP